MLHHRVLDVAPDRLDDPDRDRFLLSRGYGPMAYYAVPAAKGFLDESIVDSWATLRLAAGPASRPRARAWLAVVTADISADISADARARHRTG